MTNNNKNFNIDKDNKAQDLTLSEYISVLSDIKVTAEKLRTIEKELIEQKANLDSEKVDIEKLILSVKEYHAEVDYYLIAPIKSNAKPAGSFHQQNPVTFNGGQPLLGMTAGFVGICAHITEHTA